MPVKRFVFYILLALGMSGCSRYDDLYSAYYKEVDIDSTKLNGFWESDRLEEAKATGSYYYGSSYESGSSTTVVSSVTVDLEHVFVLKIDFPQASLSFVAKAFSIPPTTLPKVDPFSGFPYLVRITRPEPVDRTFSFRLEKNRLYRSGFSPDRPVVWLAPESRIVRLDDSTLDIAVQQNGSPDLFHVLHFNKTTAADFPQRLHSRQFSQGTSMRPAGNVEGLHTEFWWEVMRGF